jgi:hypothetical protein
MVYRVMTVVVVYDEINPGEGQRGTSLEGTTKRECGTLSSVIMDKSACLLLEPLVGG